MMNGSFGSGWIPPLDGSQEQINTAGYGQCDQLGNPYYANFQQGWGNGVNTYPHHHQQRHWRQQHQSWRQQSSQTTGNSPQRSVDSQMGNGMEYFDSRCFNGTTRQELQHDGRYSQQQQQQPYPQQLGDHQFQQQWNNGQTRAGNPQIESSYMLARRWSNNGNVWRGYPRDFNGGQQGRGDAGGPYNNSGTSTTNGCYDQQAAGGTQQMDNRQQRNASLYYASGARRGWGGQQMVQNNPMNSEQQQCQQQQEEERAYNQGQQSSYSYFQTQSSGHNGEFCGSGMQQSSWMYQSNQAEMKNGGVLDCYQNSAGMQSQQPGQSGQPGSHQAQESFAVASSCKDGGSGEGVWNQTVLISSPGAADDTNFDDTKGSDNSSGDKIEGRDTAAQMTTGHSNLEAHSDNPIGEAKLPVPQWPNCRGKSAGYHSWQSVDVKDNNACNAKDAQLSAENRVCQQQSSENGDGSSGGKTNSGSNQPLSDSGHCDAKVVEQTESGPHPGYRISNAMKRSKRSGRHAAKAMVLMMEEEESKEEDADRDYLLKHNMRKAKALAAAAGRVAIKEMGDLEESANAHMDVMSDAEAAYMHVLTDVCTQSAMYTKS